MEKVPSFNSDLTQRRSLMKIAAPRSLLDSLLCNPGQLTINFGKRSLTNGNLVCNFKPDSSESLICRLDKYKRVHSAGTQVSFFRLETGSCKPVKSPSSSKNYASTSVQPSSLISAKEKLFPKKLNILKDKQSLPAKINSHKNPYPTQISIGTNPHVPHKAQKPVILSSQPTQHNKFPRRSIDNRQPNDQILKTLKCGNQSAPPPSKYPRSIKSIRSQISKLDSSGTPSPSETHSVSMQNTNELFKRYISLHKIICDRKKKIQYYLEFDFNVINELDYKLSIQQIKKLTCEKNIAELQDMITEYKRLHQIFSAKQRV